jgi:allophanate hydrolase subunit 1
MADLSSLAQTVSNAGATLSVLTTNFGKHVISQSDAGRELIIKVALTNMTDANVTTIRNAITQAGGVAGVLPASTGDAFTVAAIGTATGVPFVSGTTDVLFMRVQGTGTFDTTDAAAGIGGCAVTVEAVFTPAL